MKKVICILLSCLLVVSMAGCSVENKSTDTDIQTQNGITRTVTTTTVNGETETETVYTDEDGNVLDEATGEAAFAGADTEQIVEDASEEAEEAVEAEEDTLIEATLAFSNEMDVDITDVYMTTQDSDEWGESLLDDIFTAGTENLEVGTVSYYTDSEFKVNIVCANGDDIVFENVTLDTVAEPENVVLVFTLEDGGYFVEAQ